MKKLSRQPSLTEWLSLYEESQRHAVVGVMLRGLETLPLEQRPPQDLLLQWIGMGEMIRVRNKTLNEKCLALQTKFEREGYNICILKGQGNALMYPDPIVRQSGDIDIWVNGERDDIIDFIRQKGHIGHIDIKHCDWEIFNDTPVEVHFIPTWFYNPFINKKLQRWLEIQKAGQFDNKSELGFNVPDVKFNLVYVLIHIYRHLFDEGIGLRQLMDYYYVLLHSSKEERQEALATLESFKMKRFVGAVMYVMKEVFRLDEQYFICQPIEKEGPFLLNEVEQAGNFGHYDSRVNHQHGGRWFNGWQNVKRNLRFVWRYPQEVCWMPVWKIWHWCWRKKKGYL